MPAKGLNVHGEMSEAAWQSMIVGAARVYGWTRIYHAPNGGAPQRNGRRVVGGQIPEGKGFPDLVLLRDAHLIVAELKTARGRVDPAQTEWLDAWVCFGIAVNEHAQAGATSRVTVRLWRPADWTEVEATLRGECAKRSDLEPLPNA